MELVKIKDFKEGLRTQTVLLVTSVVRGTTNSGSPYLNIVLQDNSGSIDAKLWDAKPEIIKLVEAGRLYIFNLEIINYKNRLQAKILAVMPAIQDEYDPQEFLASSSMNKDELRNRIDETIVSLNNENIKKIVRSMVIKYEDKFYEYPAASKIHHSFVGGLATHTISMLGIGEAVCRLYPEVNRDLLLGGIILHDLGKTEELSGNMITEYTNKGKLLGHISIVNQSLYETLVQLHLEESEEGLLLQHLVLSHHGHLEFGSPVLPKVLEAEILSQIDNLDSRVNSISQALSEVEPGEYTSKLFYLENRQFYKPIMNNSKTDE